MLDLALITARGGSVGLPRKNVLLLGDIPLIGWTIRGALSCGIFKRVVVSTDDEEIALCARAFGAETPFVRPAELASSTANSIDVVHHALRHVDHVENFALIQPTSPFRNARHLREAADMFADGEAGSVIGVAKSKPVQWLYQIDHSGFLRPVVEGADQISRRQDAAAPVCPNGSLYITSKAQVARSNSLFAPRSRPYTMDAISSIDIDDINDFELAEAVVTAGLRKIDL